MTTLDFCTAIAGRRLVSFIYDNRPRVVIPGAHGPHITTGNHVLRGYQVDGTSSSRPIPSWALFRADRMLNFGVLDERFESDPPGFEKGDSAIAVHCEL